MSETFVFFGSGPVAAKSLELLDKNFNIEAVVTKPKPDHHKGSFPVIEIANKLNIPTKTVANRQELSALISSKPFKSKFGVLVDFGIIVGQDVIDYFPSGIINSHFSILPEWRGADPITFAVLSGQKSTGVSLMQLVEKMDEGPLLAYGEYQLPKDITTPKLTEHLIYFSDQMLKNELPKYVDGVKLSPQSVTKRKISYSRKLKKQDGIIDWNKPAEELEREVRAFQGWPGSKCRIFDKDITINQAYVVNTSTNKPGSIIDDPEKLIIACGNNALCIERLTPAGKKQMSGASFIAGYARK